MKFGLTTEPRFTARGINPETGRRNFEVTTLYIYVVKLPGYCNTLADECLIQSYQVVDKAATILRQLNQMQSLNVYWHRFDFDITNLKVTVKVQIKDEQPNRARADTIKKYCDANVQEVLKLYKAALKKHMSESLMPYYAGYTLRGNKIIFCRNARRK